MGQPQPQNQGPWNQPLPGYQQPPQWDPDADRRLGRNVFLEWRKLGSRTRKEVERYAKEGHPHPDPKVQDVAVLWAHVTVAQTKALKPPKTGVRGVLDTVKMIFLFLLLIPVAILGAGIPGGGSSKKPGTLRDSPADRRLALAILTAAGLAAPPL